MCRLGGPFHVAATFVGDVDYLKVIFLGVSRCLLSSTNPIFHRKYVISRILLILEIENQYSE